MANLTKIKRDEMIAFLEELKKTHNDDNSIRAFNEIENTLTEKKFGLVFEEHTEEVDERLLNEIPVFCADETRKICKDKNLPYNFIIEGDNLQALYLLEKTHRGKIDCIYIDPPYNTGAKDWKYNNDYVDSNDNYRHSKWLSMMKSRLLIAKKLLKPSGFFAIAIDGYELFSVGHLLDEIFQESNRIGIVTVLHNPKGRNQSKFFSANSEYMLIYANDEKKAFFNKVAISDDVKATFTEQDEEGRYRWEPYIRARTVWRHEARPDNWYPIYVSKDLNEISSEEIKDSYVLYPITSTGEFSWKNVKSKFDSLNKNGYFKAFDEDGKIVLKHKYREQEVLKNVWLDKKYQSEFNGTNLLKNILNKNVFNFPKSLYLMEDIFKILTKKDSIVLDFFAGSGTTLHAINLLNAEDGGQRKCIVVTNNEISAEEEKKLSKLGYNKGDEEWEKYGIAKYVTWPRTLYSINGTDSHGKPLSGNYNSTDKNGKAIAMSDGFKSNVKYFKCDWTPRKPEDYLLSNVLCLHIKEMIELENAIEIDYEKNVIILNKDDFNNYILDKEKFDKIEKMWVNQNILFNSDELKILNEKSYKYIPKEYFGQELKEANE